MEPAEYVTTRRIALVSNKLQDGRNIQVISFDPPEEGGPDGRLVVRCPTQEDYRGICHFLDQEDGSLLNSTTGQWRVHRINDDARPEEAFPQHIAFRVDWRPR